MKNWAVAIGTITLIICGYIFFQAFMTPKIFVDGPGSGDVPLSSPVTDSDIVIEAIPQLTVEETKGWLTYTNSQYQFEIKYPKDFVVDGPEEMPVIYKGKLVSPTPNSPSDPYSNTVGIGFVNRAGDLWKSIFEACDAEVCGNLHNLETGGDWGQQYLQINNALGVKVWSTATKYYTDYYLQNEDRSQILRVTTWNGMEGADNILAKDFATTQKIMKTFKFVGKASGELSQVDAVALVRKLPEVTQYLKDVPNGIIAATESEDKTVWTVQVFEVVEDHTATFNWFDVNKKTKEIVKMF
jgi:hypothetical protein